MLEQVRKLDVSEEVRKMGKPISSMEAMKMAQAGGGSMEVMKMSKAGGGSMEFAKKGVGSMELMKMGKVGSVEVFKANAEKQQQMSAQFKASAEQRSMSQVKASSDMKLTMGGGSMERMKLFSKLGGGSMERMKLAAAKAASSEEMPVMNKAKTVETGHHNAECFIRNSCNIKTTNLDCATVTRGQSWSFY